MIHRSKSATLLGHDHSQHFKQAAKKSLSDAVQKKLDQEQAQFSTPINSFGTCKVENNFKTNILGIHT